MRQQSQAQLSAAQVLQIPDFAIATDRHRAALNKLTSAFEKKRSISVLFSDSKVETSHIVSAFAASLEDDVTVVRLKRPHADALTAMQEINRTLGFEPQNLCLSDLRKILIMFLQHQSEHKCRTVLCVEQADLQALWLLDTIASLVKFEVTKNCGLMIVLAGNSSLEVMLEDASLGCISSNAGKPIRLAPFTLEETREFVRQRSEATNAGDVTRVFEMDAVERLHRLSGGMPDTVGKLCHESQLLVSPNDTRPIGAKTVTKAARSLRSEASADLTISVVDSARLSEFFETDDRLLVRWNGDSIREMPLKVGRFMVGRAAFSDIVLPSPTVSRRHALIIKTEEKLQVLDLGSTNGTTVAGDPIREHDLVPGDVLNMGDCEIEYRTGA